MREIKKVSLYARVSKAGEQTAENQLLRLRAYAAQQGWQVEAEYIDEITGVRSARPALDRLRATCRGHHTDAVVATRLDRLGRSVIHLLGLFEEFEHAHVALIITEQNIDTTTPLGKFMRTLLAAIAELERSFISERTKAGLDRARAQGKRLGRPPKIKDPLEMAHAREQREQAAVSATS